MARTRDIKPGFFKNEQLAECSFAARLLFAGLWTLCDREGRLEYRPKRIKAELFPFDAVEIPELAVELNGQKLIVLYEAGGQQYLAIPTFPKHQRPHPKEAQSELPQPPNVSSTCDKAVEINGEQGKKTASCAFPSSNPLILQSSNPSPASREKPRRFVPPTVDEVAAYCAERKNGVDPEQFIAHYEANGWKVGRSPMKDWRAAVITWEKNGQRFPTGKQQFGGKNYKPPTLE